MSNYCCTTSLASGKGYNGGASQGYYGGAGGDGGCGGGCGLNRLAYNTSSSVKTVGIGYFSDGGYIIGGSARGGSLGNIASDGSGRNAITYANLSGSKGYFVGGYGAEAQFRDNAGYPGGIGGFLGGHGGDCYTTSEYDNSSGGVGGYSPYGIGGTGGNGQGNNANYRAGNGGSGRLFGGNGGYHYGSKAGGTGGNGYYPGKGGSSTSGGKGSDGYAITTGIMTSSFPLNGMTPTTSIVIIEAGDSIEDF